jgi:hypothetical protein
VVVLELCCAGFKPVLLGFVTVGFGFELTALEAEVFWFDFDLTCCGFMPVVLVVVPVCSDC